MVSNNLKLAIGLLIFAGILFAAGLLAENAEAFLFPNFVSGILCVIAIAILFNSFKVQKGEESQNKSFIPWLLILPAIVIFVLYLGLVEKIGFYVTSFVAFVAIVLIYAPDKFSIQQSVKIISIGFAFLAALYSLFTVLLKVQLPSGFFL